MLLGGLFRINNDTRVVQIFDTFDGSCWVPNIKVVPAKFK